jgi:(1->4)-alpha-D-glucan 1-alpha-D-glucosylmutase
MNGTPRENPVPLSTYRVQFGPHFSFRDGAAIVPYLAALGVGDLYASPYFAARRGSEHGYDIVDHNRFNPEIGTADEHRAMVDALHAHGMGHIVDFVPNHMGIGLDNPWWRDILAWGPLSPYAEFFDIDWHRSSAGRGKVVLPVLGDHYGRVVEDAQLAVTFVAEQGRFRLTYFDHAFPLTPPSYALLLESAARGAERDDAAATLRELAAAFGALRGRPRDVAKRTALRERAGGLQQRLAEVARDPEIADAIAAAAGAIGHDPDRIDALVAAQHYRLAFWRIAAEEINYRRFFDVNDLAGLRVEDAEVLARTHELVFAMIADGRIGGLRIDHIDGLSNPSGYVNLLVDRAAALEHPLYLVVEKILLGGEQLRADWRIAGTTGYDFLNDVLGVFVDSRNERLFDRVYERVLGRATTFADEAYEAKRRIMRFDLASELQVLVDALTRIARSDRRSSDFTPIGLRRALIEIVAAFPVYRTYVIDDTVGDDDRAVIETAIAGARRRREVDDAGVYDFLRDVLTAALTNVPGTHYDRRAVLRVAMKFQQYTGPVTAKSLEDTAFYRYVRLAALNEVGGEPARFGRSVADLHAANAERARTHPNAMIATATHDHKRGEDTRLRMAALSEFPAEWSRAVARWDRMNAGFRTTGEATITPTAEYLFYQTVVGTLPPAWLTGDDPTAEEHAAYVERVAAYALKAAREAKLRTEWTAPDEDYEAALDGFVRAALAPNTPYLRDVRALTAQLAPLAAIHGLAQLTLKLTAPGVPDVYQGTELWDFSLVDPDNRRPVDYATRTAMLASFAAHADDLETLATALRETWPDGRLKLYVTWRLLQLRRRAAATFLGSSYRALPAGTGDVVAFARDDIVTIVPRLARARYDGLRVRFPTEQIALNRANASYRNVLDGRTLVTSATGDLALADAFAVLPVAVLEPLSGD